LYLTVDCVLLACVFEKCRCMAIKTYELDPVHYFSAPGYAFDCALKLTKVELELFTKVDDYISLKREFVVDIA